MEPVARARTPPALPRNGAVSSTLAASMALQCLSPTAKDLPENVFKRVKDIETQQRQLISQLERSAGNYSSSSHEDKQRVSPEPKTASPQMAPQQEYHQTPPTPPFSSTFKSHKGGQSPPLTPPLKPSDRVGSRSFGDRRQSRPLALDLNALRRERQFSGPYSANPLLPRKRREPEEPISSSEKRDSLKRLRGSPMEPEPQAMGKTIRLPLISQMTAAPFVAKLNSATPDLLWPPTASPSQSSATTALPLFADRAPTLRARPASAIPVTATSRNRSPLEPGTAVSPRTTTSRSASSEIKARYMELCSEMWDLLHS